MSNDDVWLKCDFFFLQVTITSCNFVYSARKIEKAKRCVPPGQPYLDARSLVDVFGASNGHYRFVALPNALLHQTGCHLCKNLKSSTVTPSSEPGHRFHDSLSEAKHDSKCIPGALCLLQWHRLVLRPSRVLNCVKRCGLCLTQVLQMGRSLSA